MDQYLKDCHLDHVAIAVKDIDKAQQIYEHLGLKFDDEREEVHSQKVLTAFAPIDQKAHIELLMPTSENGPIAKFIEKKGEGIHHLCFRVQDILKKQEELKSKGFQFIYDTPQNGANDCLVNFIHPKSAGGVLIEISQKKGKA